MSTYRTPSLPLACNPIVAALVTLLALTGLGIPAVAAQEVVAFVVTVQVFNCPHGMTPDALVGDDCALATEGFDIKIGSLEGIMQPHSLADASFDGSAYTWNLATSTPGPGEPPPPDRGPRWLISEVALPNGYTDFVVVGDDVSPYAAGGDEFRATWSDPYKFQTTWGDPTVSLAIYNFTPISGGDTGAAGSRYARITLHVADCPRDTADLFGECHENRVSGFTFYIAGKAKTTDANGVATGAPGAGRRSIRADVNDFQHYARSYVYCSDQVTGEVLFDGMTFSGVYVTTTAGQPVICDWYLLIEPADAYGRFPPLVAARNDKRCGSDNCPPFPAGL